MKYVIWGIHAELPLARDKNDRLEWATSKEHTPLVFESVTELYRFVVKHSMNHTYPPLDRQLGGPTEIREVSEVFKVTREYGDKAL